MAWLFQGWRRKIGVVTLVLACAFAGAWVRSINHLDMIDINHTRKKGKPANSAIVSACGKFAIIPGTQFMIYMQTTSPPIHIKLCKNITIWHFTADRVKWTSMAANSVGIYEHNSDPRPLINMIPYWICVLPFTLLSAYLLLSKPRQLTPIRTPNAALDVEL